MDYQHLRCPASNSIDSFHQFPIHDPHNFYSMFRKARRGFVSFCFVISISLLLLGARCAVAQTDGIAKFQPRVLAVVNARIVTQPGMEISRGTLLIRDGLIVAVGMDVTVPPEADVIEGENLHVYAGFIDAAAYDFLDPAKKPTTSAGRKVDFSRYVLAATRPDNRRGLTPEHLATNQLKLDAKTQETVRKLGFTAVHVLPQSRIAGGQGTLISTAGVPVREAVLSESTFTEFQLFAMRGGSNSTSAYPSTLMGATAHLRQAFLDAQRYSRHWKLYRIGAKSIERPPTDPMLESLASVLEKKRRVVFRAHSRDDIHRALDFCNAFDLHATLWGGREAYKCIDRIKKHNVALITQIDFGDEPKIEPNANSEKFTADFKPPLRVQEERKRLWKERVAGLGRLEHAQIPFAISSSGLKDRSELLKNLRLAITEGLSRHAALSALTLDAARILGIEKRLGTLAAGKLAHVVVMTGPFDHEKSKVRYVLIDGNKYEYNSDAKPVVQDPVVASKPEPAGNTNEKRSKIDLAGTWNMKIDTADGTLSAVLTLTQDGDRLEGTFTSEHGNGKLTSGSISEKRAEFVVSIGAGDRDVKLKFETNDTGENGKLSGELKPAFGAATHWTATRTAGSNPKARSSVHVAQSDKNDKNDDQSQAKKSSSEKTPSEVASKNDSELPTELKSDRLKQPFQTGGNVLITNATVLTGTEKTLLNTSILVKNGKIAAVGTGLKPEPGMKVIDASHRFVMPGIIDTHSHIMISGGVNESTQSIVPEVRIKDTVRTDDVSEYRALAGGVTVARLFHGSANVIGGQDAVVKLKYGKTAKEHILHDAPQGVKFALGENVKFRTGRFPDTRLGVEATLNRAFLEAIDYRRRWKEYEQAVAELKQNGSESSDSLLPPRRDLRLETLSDIVNHEKFIHSHCYRADEILMLLRVASDLGIRVWSLQHVLEGYKIAPEIVAHGASCSTFSDWWAYKVEAYDATPYNAALLKEAGANVVIKSDNRELIRHLYLEAAKTVRYGNMHPDHALQTITLNPARELGLDERMGSIEVGKEANLAIFNGHPLNAFSRCEMTLIDGEVYFSRDHAASAMSVKAARLSAHPKPLVFTAPEVRSRKLDLTKSETDRYAIVGATLHTVDKSDILNGTILIEGNKITAVGSEVQIPTGTKVIDGKGLHVSPGFIDAGTTLGLVEIGKVRETHDYSEGGQLQPDLRAGVGLNVDSELIPVARAGGITSALIRPTGGIIAGQASLVKLAGWTSPEMILDMEAGLQINWPRGSNAKQRQKQLEEFLKLARTYDKLRSVAQKNNKPGPISDPRLDALRPYLKGEKPVFIEADSRKQIAEALLFAEKEKLKIIITGGTDAWKLAKELKKRNVPVIVGPVMRRPVENYDPFDAPYANPGRLSEAGVTFCIRSDNASNSRNAPFEAAMAVAYGLPETEGLRAVTLSAAEVLGISKQLGSLTPGKLANLVISDGPPLQQTSQIKGVFIEGNPFAPESRQTRFYERYRRRLHEVQKKNGKLTSAGTK